MFKNIFKSILVLLLLSQAAMATTFTLENDVNNTVDVGNTIDIYVNFTNTDNAVLFQVEISYDNTLLRLDNVVLQQINTEVLNTTYPNANTVKLDILGGDLSAGQPIQNLGTGRLVKLTFTALAAGTSDFTLNNIVIRDLANQDITPNPQPTVNAITVTTPVSTINLSSNTVAIGDVVVGQNGTATVTMTNTGTATMNNINITSDNALFTATGCPATLAAGASCTITITFSPNVTGNQTANITVTSDANNSPQTITATGNGVAATSTIALSTANINFGDVVIGQVGNATVTMTNTGNADMNNITATINPAEFAIANTTTCGTTLAAGASCIYNLTFTPNAANAYAGTLTITSDANNSPQTVNLIGNGINNPPAPAQPTPVPTMSAWGLMIMSALLGLFAVRRRA